MREIEVADKTEDQIGSADPLDLDTEAERQQYYDDLHLNPERLREGNNVDIMSQQLGDSGNENTLSSLNEMASVSGGELGKNRTLERDVDQSLQARTGDRSFNLSENRQEMHAAKWDGELNDVSTQDDWSADEVIELKPDLNSLLAEHDPDLAAERLMEEILQRHPELEDDVYDASMAGDAFAVLSALEEIAHVNDMGDLSQYAQGVNEAAADQGNIRAMIYLNPLMPVVDIAGIDPDERSPAPAAAAAPTLNDPVYNQQIIQPPTAPV